MSIVEMVSIAYMYRLEEQKLSSDAIETIHW